MDSLLEKIYNGREIIQTEPLDDEKFNRILEEQVCLYNEFKKGLTTERLHTLDELLESHNKMANLTHQHYFRQGFSIGVRLLFESME